MRPPARSARLHLVCSVLLAAGATVPLVLGAGGAPWLLLVLLGLLSFLLNLNVLESALVDLHVARPVPRLPARDFAGGIPVSDRTCVVYPVLFERPAQLADFLPNLARSMRANPDPNLRWVVVSASPAAIAREERRRLRTLQRRFSAHHLGYLHRDPSFGNWEKKRGSYMHLMVWLVSGAPRSGRLTTLPEFPSMKAGRAFDVVAGRVEGLAGARNLLIGDSDTVWPAGSARTLVERIAHPDNRAFTIFQGRLAPRNDEESIFSNLQGRLYRLSRAAHGARWTVFGRISYAGHGAGWNVRLFLDRLAGKMEEGYLSHDIVESYFLRTAFVTEVETTERAQATVQDIVRQWRRWWIGNRIAATRLLGPWRRDEAGRRVRNRNPAGKLLLLDACRNYVMPVVLAGYLLVAGALALIADLTFLFTVVGGIYFAFIMLRFYLPLLVKIDGMGSAGRILFTLAFLTALVQVLMIEKAKIVLADTGRLLVRRTGRGYRVEWVVQDSVRADRSLASAVGAGWSHSVGALSLMLLLPAAPTTLAVLGLVAATPALLWLGSRSPPRWLRGEA